MSTRGAPLVEVSDLCLDYATDEGAVHALRGASMQIFSGEAVALLGESGSGKSTLARCLAGLLPRSAVQITAGTIRLAGKDVTDSSEAEWRSVRGGTVGMVFQDPLTFLNPVMRVDRQIREGVRIHDREEEAPAERVRDLLAMVQLPSEVAHSYPHELSGGMRQRVLLAIALACRPSILIADEPTTALDVTTQAGILSLLQQLRSEVGMALLLVSHDLALLAGICERVYVMYAGQTIEAGGTEDVFGCPRHPYTKGLLDAAEVARDGSGEFATIPGYPPRLSRPIEGCAFAPRCWAAHGACTDMPGDMIVSGERGHSVRCWMQAGSEAS